MRELDWSRTAVGPVTLWPQSLKTALSILLDSGYAMYIAWGREFTQFYNDAYRPILGAKKHPAALGQATSECFAEIWDFIGPMFRRVLDEGKNTTLIDQLLPLDRYGYVEECYFTFSYSAIRDESGGVGGVLVTVIETTERVLEERRQLTLRELVSRALEANTAQEVVQRAAQTLAANPHDIPFALLYLNESTERANLSGAAGPGLGPASIELADDLAQWPLGAAGRSGERLFHLYAVADRMGVARGLAWPEPVTEAAILPIAGLGVSVGYLVAGLNPRHSLDTHYRSFLLAIAGHLAAALAKVRAYEVERQRAESLAELDRAKTNFFSNVSHEFRTPLTLILGPLEEMLSMQAGLPAAARDLAEVTHRNGLRLQRLVNSLLDFSRIEAGRMEASFEATELGGFTAEIASTFRSAMEKAGLGFVVDCPPVSEPVFVDREMWEKIVLNLLSNALKYTLEGSIAIRLRETDGRAVLSVQDTGTGIPESELPKLFERFHRVEGARGRTREGAGIGLALVAELIKLHGGRVDVESNFGTGSVFRVSLASGSAHLPPEHVRPQSLRQDRGLASSTYVDQAFAAGDSSRTAGDSQSRREGQLGHVLVADDNADLRDYVSRLLSPRYEVDLASNGDEALTRIRDRRPDLVLSDVMMPGLDGFGLLRALRENPATSTLPVVLLSARAGEEARIEGLNVGATDYLAKPFTARELLARVESQMELARVRAQAAEREEVLRTEAQLERDRAVAILESITDGFFTLDQNWRFTYVNPAGEKLMRATQEQLLGKSHWDLFPTLVGTKAEFQYQLAVREQTPVVLEVLYQPWQRWYGVTAYPARHGGLSVYFRDITESKMTELHERRRWHAFDVALSNTPDQIYMFDTEGRFTYANRAFLDLWQRPLKEVLGKTFLELGAPTDLSMRLQGQIQRSIQTKESVRDDTEFTGASGGLRHYEYIFTPVLGTDGAVEAVVGSTRDTTDSKKFEKELGASEERLQQVFAQAPVAIIALRGKELIVELANPSYRALVQGRDLLGRPLPGVLSEIGDYVWDAMRGVLETGEAFIANEWYIQYDANLDGVNEDHWFNVVCNPRRGPSGEVNGIIAVLTDVTAQALARRVLERVNRQLEEFAFVASHDLQEPLRAVKTYTQLLLRRHINAENPDAQMFATFIDQGVSKMTHLISDLLAYSRALHRDDLLPGAAERISEADLNVSWAEALTQVAEGIKESGAVISAGPLPTVAAETGQMAHVFLNLLSNAIKYRKASHPLVVSAGAERRDGKWLIAVQDNGIGFKQEHAERIFGLFKRLHRNEYPGTGLGLAICQRIVERYHGRIWAESQPGVGSTFFVELPAAEADYNQLPSSNDP